MDIISFLCSALSCCKKYREMLALEQKKFYKLQKAVKGLEEEKASLSFALERCALSLAELREKFKKGEKEEEMEKYYNNKYPKKNISYVRRETDGQYSVDVRSFFQYRDYHLPTITGKTNDEKAYNSLMWVMKNIKYVADKTAYGFPEYWAYAYQTLKRKVGDCEDGAILLANIMMKAGIPYWRVRLNAGSVNGGGHCYVTYCRETDDKFIVLDWCYWANKKPISERPLHKDERNYSDEKRNFYIWFSWNERYAFGRMSTMAGMPKYINSKPK